MEHSETYLQESGLISMVRHIEMNFPVAAIEGRLGGTDAEGFRGLQVRRG